MKSNAIIRIIIWSLVLLILVSTLTAFLAYDRFAFHRFSKAATVETGVLVPIEESPMQDPSDVRMLTFSPDSIRDLEIEWVAGDIQIVPKDGIQEIVVREDASNDRYQMYCRTSGEKLTIRFCKESLTVGFGISIDESISKDLTIEVPADWPCEELELDMAAANLKIQDLTIREVNIDGASGTCDFENCHFANLDIDTASGDVTFSGSLDALDFDAASASFIGEFTDTPSRIDMDGMSGSLDITLPEDCGYTISIDGVSSTFRSEFQGTEMKNSSHVYGDGRCSITVDGMSCDVTIRKAATE